MKIAVLDDFQDVSRQIADWSKLPADCELTARTSTQALTNAAAG